MNQFLEQHQQAIQNICLQEGISYLALFGSHARGDQKPNSDVDLLVKYRKPVGFSELYDTEEKFKKTFKRKVDLVTVGGLKKHLFPYIKPDLVVLYEKP